MSLSQANRYTYLICVIRKFIKQNFPQNSLKYFHKTKTLRLFAALLLSSFSLNHYAAADNPVCPDCPVDPDTFLTLLERGLTEDNTTSSAYYNTVDPLGLKQTYSGWLIETGFIDNELDYTTTGNFPIDTEATVMHKNVADLNFVRLVHIRCEPDCDSNNPDIYSVIENYRTFADATLRQNRLASVTMEWVSAIDGSNPSKKFVIFYAYDGMTDSRLTNTPDSPFAPDLDGRGNKHVPGLCNSCHGGEPLILTNVGQYPKKGNTRSLFLPLDLDNFEFGNGPGQSRVEQEAAYKRMNEIVLLTHDDKKKFDEVAGFRRHTAAYELIQGWYGGDNMPNDSFDGEFLPAGWQPPHAPANVEELYHESVAPACRACHVQQKRELDFGTYKGFMVFKDAHQELVLQVECGPDDDSNRRGNGEDDQAVMPLALETYKIFWDPTRSNQADVFKEFIEPAECED